MLDFFRKLFSSEPAEDYNALLRDGALLLDVRTTEEFESGHINGAVNIPLDQIRNNLPELKKKNKPLITYCRSGMRSSNAKAILEQAGLIAYNGGGYASLTQKLSQGR